MKKLFLFFLLTGVELVALPIGNPLEPTFLHRGVCFQDCPYDEESSCYKCNLFSLQLGYYGDFVFDRHMSIDRPKNHSTIRKTEIMTNAGYVSVNFCDKFDIFGTLGASRIFIDSPIGTFGTVFLGQSGRRTWRSSSDFSWSAGARLVAWQCGCLALGFEGQYFYTQPKLTTSYSDGAPFQINFFDGQRMRFREWQLGGALGVKIPVNECYFFSPYLGVKWSHATIHSNDAGNVAVSPIRLFNLENRREWGYCIGLSFIGCDAFELTGEVRFIDETAAYVNANFRL